MQKIVGIKFNETGKVFYFSPNGLALKKGDHVIVETGAGSQFGIVDFAEREIDEKKFGLEIKPVSRLTTQKDEEKRKKLDAKRLPTIKTIKDKVAKLKLNMKVSDAHWTFDGSKLIVEFTADDRVDFRELLKDLAATFKVRIELKQIGQRDEVKNKGGLGPCGQPCCCKRFLNDFEHVTVKMAKNQGISLSPTKINGLCGRLMCCLGYENKTYEEVLKRMPKVGSEVTSPKGKGTVVYLDILRELVSVKLAGNDGSMVVEEFPLNQIKFNKKGE